MSYERAIKTRGEELAVIKQALKEAKKEKKKERIKDLESRVKFLRETTKKLQEDQEEK